MGNFRNLTLVMTSLIFLILIALFAVLSNSHRNSSPVRSLIASDGVHSSLRVAPRLGSNTPLIARPLYPYSIVPGGVGSARELANAINHDPVVAKHYAGFNTAAARVVKLHGDQSAYVSYRIGEEVFWTRKRIVLHDNEIVITDGNFEARTRCGNRVSKVAQQPISSREPAPEIFEAAQNPSSPSMPDVAIELPLNLRPSSNLVSIGSSFDVIESAKPNSIGFPVEGTPPFTSMILGGLVPLYNSTVPPPPPVVTPEPDTGLLLLMVLSAGWLAKRRIVCS